MKVIHRRKGHFMFVILIYSDEDGRAITEAKYIYGLDWSSALKGKILGKATCNPADSYNEKFGIELALQRGVKSLYAYDSQRVMRKARQELQCMFQGTEYNKPVIRADLK